MVLPDNYEPGHKYPLIITSYTCGHGFLNGGGSDNAPEFVAAHQGFLVICADVPIFEIMARESDLSRIYPIACDIVSALIADQDKAGSIDSARVGLSGHSYGSDFGSYCLAHSLGENPARGIAAAAFRSGSVLERESWDLFETAAWRRDSQNGIYALRNCFARCDNIAPGGGYMLRGNRLAGKDQQADKGYSKFYLVHNIP